MSTYKVIKENKYVTIHNEFFEIATLSFGAKGLLAYLISKPADWKIRKTDLIKKSTGGQTQIDGYLLELMAHGFMNWYVVKDENNQIKEWVYEVYEMPYLNPKKDECIKEGQRRIENKKAKTKAKNAKKKPQSDNPIVENKPQSDNPTVDNPTVDNHPFTNKENTKKDNTNKDNNIVNNRAFTKIELIEHANSFYNQMAPSRWNKKQWETIVNKLINEKEELNFQDFVNYPLGYIEGCLKEICKKHDINHGKIDSEYEEALNNSPIPHFDYINN